MKSATRCALADPVNHTMAQVLKIVRDSFAEEAAQLHKKAGPDGNVRWNAAANSIQLAYWEVTYAYLVGAGNDQMQDL